MTRRDVPGRRLLARLRWAVLSVGAAWVLAGCPGGDGGGGVGGY